MSTRSNKSAPKAKPVTAGKPAAGVAATAPLGHLQGFSAALLVLIVAGGLYLASPASFMVLATGLAPSVIAIFFESGQGRSVIGCMACLNLAGVVPVVSLLWHRGDTMNAAAQLLRDPYMWLLMYGSAALALGLLWAAPIVAQLVIDANARHERARLQQAQQALIEEWGETVSGELEPPAE